MTLTLTDLQYRILELIVENSDADLGRFNRAESLVQDLEPTDTITAVQSALVVLEKKHFIVSSSAKSYSPTPQGRKEI
jgi:hypothetical protein